MENTSMNNTRANLLQQDESFITFLPTSLLQKGFLLNTLLALFLFFLLPNCFAQATEYTLRPGDIISIHVVDNPEFSIRSKIRPDGRINFAVLGDIQVAGFTTVEVVKKMEEKLQPYVNNAAVSVTIEQYFANKIFLIGELNSNGEYEIFEPVDVIRAISMAGGLKNPKTKDARIIRANGEIVAVPVRQLFTQSGAAKNERYILHPGDTFYVPKQFAIPWSAWNLIVATISSTLTLYILISQLNK